MDLLFKEECYKIIGAAMNVHKILGTGFAESVYQEAFSIELKECGIPFEKEKEIKVIYKGHELEKSFRVDFLCYNKIIVELKAVNLLATEHTAQVLNYLHVCNCKIGLLINFGELSLKYKRIIK